MPAVTLRLSVEDARMAATVLAEVTNQLQLDTHRASDAAKAEALEAIRGTVNQLTDPRKYEYKPDAGLQSVRRIAMALDTAARAAI